MGTHDLTDVNGAKDTPEIKIFLSSPGDVNEERVLAGRVMTRLTERYAPVAQLVPIIWEHEPLLATATFQDQIEKPSATDIVICILWSRLGTRLPAHILRDDGSRYESGTEFEFEDAWHGMQRTGRPDLLVYRKMAEPFVSLADDKSAEERLRQKRALDGFIQKWFHDQDGSLLAAFHGFGNSAEFEEAFEAHLDKLIQRRLEELGIEDIHAVNAQEPASRSRWEGSPFRGLESFEFEHAPILYGRTHAISGVLKTLRNQATKGQAFVLVLGRSGGGKSSLVRAGVMPLLVEPGVVEGVGLWRRAVFRPSEASGGLVEAFAAALTGPTALPELLSDGTSLAELADLLGSTPKGADLLLKGALSQAAQKVAFEAAEASASAKPDMSDAARAQERRDILENPPQAKLALLVDQLEELFTDETIPEAERQAFLEAISALAESGRVYVVATLRSDFYQHAIELPTFASLKGSDGQYDLTAPTPAEIGQIIRQPALSAGLVFEEHPETGARLDDVLRDVAVSEPDSLPLLEFTLEELYRARSPSGVLTWEAYEALGGLAGALGRRAEDAYLDLPAPAQAALPQVMRQIVHMGLDRDQAPTKRPAAMEGFPPNSPARQLVDAFVTARLFVVGGDSAGNSLVTLTHEALISSWPRLQKWLDDDLDFLRIRARVNFAAERWEEAGREAQLLLPKGRPLDEARQIANDDEIDLSPQVASFISLSIARATRAARLKQAAVAALILLTVTASGTAWYADGQRREAASARIVSDEAKARAQASAVQASAARATAETRLGELFREQGRQALLNGRAEEATLLLGAAYGSAPTDRNGALFSTARDLASIKGGSTLVHSGQITAIASMQGDLVAVAADDGSIAVRDMVSGKNIARHIGDDSAIQALRFSPGGHILAAGGDSGTVLLWDLETQAKQMLDGHFRPITQLQFSPDGERLTSLSHDKTTRVWNVKDGQSIATLAGQLGTAITAAFSKDGSQLTILNDEGEIAQWDSTSGQELWRCTTEAVHPVRDALILGDNLAVLASGEAGVIQVAMDATCATQWQNPNPALGLVRDLSGNRLLVRNESQVAIVDTTTGDLISSLDAIVGSTNNDHIITAALTADAGLIGVLDNKGTLTLSDASGAGVIAKLKGHAASGSVLAFSGDGNTLTTGSVDGTIRAWHLTTLRPCLMPGTSGRVVAFSPDGQQVASGDSQGQLALAQTGNCAEARLLPVNPNRAWVQDIIFSNDGTQIAVASGSMVSLLDAASGDLIWNSELPDTHFATSLAWNYGNTGILVGTRGLVPEKDKGGWLELDLANGATVVESKNINVAVSDISLWNEDTYVMTRNTFGLDLWWHDTALLRHRVVGKSTRAVAFWPDKTRIAVGNSTGQVSVIRHTSSELFRFNAHNAPVTAVAVNADGTVLASGANDGTAALWNAKTGALIVRLKGHSGKIASIGFVPGSDYVLSAATDGSVNLWDPAVASPVARFDGPAGPRPRLDISPKGTWFGISVGRENTRLWSLPRAKVAPTEIVSEISTVTPWGLGLGDDLPKDRWNALALQFLADHQISDGGKIVLLDARKRLEEGRIAAVRGDALAAGLSWNQLDDTSLVAATALPELPPAYGHAITSNAVNLEGLQQVLTEHQNRVEDIAFSHDGQLLASSDWTSKLVIWNTDDWSKRFVLEDNFDGEIQFSPDDSLLLTKGKADGLVVTNLETGAETLRLPVGRSGFWSPDASRIAAFPRVGPPVIFDATSGNELARFTGFGKTIGFSISADFTILAAPSEVGLALVDTVSREVNLTMAAPKSVVDQKSVTATFSAFSPDGKLVAVVWSDKSGALFTTDDGRIHAALPKGVATVQFSPDGTKLVAGVVGERASLISVQDGSLIANVDGSPNALRSFLQGGSLFATSGGTRKAVLLFETATGAPAGEYISHATAWVQIAGSPDERWRVTTSGDGQLRVWKGGPMPGPMSRASALPDDREEGVLAQFSDAVRVERQGNAVVLTHSSGSSTVLSGHRGTVTAAGFTHDGDRVITGGEDGKLLIWNRETTSLLRSISEACKTTVAAVLPTPDSSAIWLHCANGELRLIEAASGRVLIIQFALPPPNSETSQMSFSQDGTRLRLVGPNGPYHWKIAP